MCGTNRFAPYNRTTLQHGRSLVKPSPLEAKANALEREIKAMKQKLDRLLPALESRKLKLNRLHNLIVSDAGADLLIDE